MNHYYITFATETEFLGATVVEGFSAKHALDIATNNGINPGGQAMIICIPNYLLDAPDIEPLKYKLFTSDQMKDLVAKRHGDLDDNIKMALEYNTTVIE